MTASHPADQIAHAVAQLVKHDELHAVDRVLGEYLAGMPPAEWGTGYRIAAFRMLGKYGARLKMYGVRVAEIANPEREPFPVKVSQERIGIPARRVECSSNFFILHFPRDKQVYKAAVLLPNAQTRNGAVIVPPTLAAAEQVAEFARLHGFTIEPGFFARVAELEETAAEMARASRAGEANYDVQGLRMALRPYQQAGVQFGVEHAKGRVFLCDEMGLGKTAQALAIVKKMEAWPLLVICPASLKYNWQKEARNWLWEHAVVMPEYVGDEAPSVVIVNYDVLAKMMPYLKKRRWAAVILDESHYLKDGTTARAKNVRKLMRGVKVRIAITGTPVVNRISDLISQLSLIGRLNDLGGFWAFAERYCAAKKLRHGWDLSGRANAEELHERLRASCFVRRLKKHVLPELPPKIRATVPIALDNQEEYDRAHADIVEWLKEQAAAPGVEQIETWRENAELLKFEALKQIAVRGKMAQAKAWIANFLESGERLVVFAEHTEIVDELAAHFNCAKIYGATSARVRDEVVTLFQQGKLPVIVCNIKAAGVGLTLTAASNCAFIEQGWNPATMDQAEDRFHRFGQRRSVTCWYLMAARSGMGGKDTIDWTIHNIIQSKRGTINAAVDGEDDERSVKMGIGILREMAAAILQPALDL